MGDETRTLQSKWDNDPKEVRIAMWEAVSTAKTPEENYSVASTYSGALDRFWAPLRYYQSCGARADTLFEIVNSLAEVCGKCYTKKEIMTIVSPEMRRLVMISNTGKRDAYVRLLDKKRNSPEDHERKKRKKTEKSSEGSKSTALVLSKSRALHEAFVDEVRKSFSGEYGMAVVKPSEIAERADEAKLVDQFVDEFLTLFTLRDVALKSDQTVILYVLGEWNMTPSEESGFHCVIEKGENESMEAFVSGLK